MRTLTFVKREEVLTKLRKTRVRSHLCQVPGSLPLVPTSVLGSVRVQVSLQPPAPPYCRAPPPCWWLSENIWRPAPGRGGAGAEKAGGPASARQLRNKLELNPKLA